MDWRARSACRDEDPELFFPSATTGPDFERQVAAAKEICGRCEVSFECLQYAVANGEEAGIWGGMTEHERKRFVLHAAWRREPIRVPV